MAAVHCSAFSGKDDTTTPAPVGDASTDDASAGVPPVRGGPPIVLDFADAPSQILTGTSATVTVKVQREGAQRFSGLVHVELAPVDGVSATPIDIQADHETGVLTIAVAQDRKHGETPLSIMGSSPGTVSVGTVVYTTLIRGPAGAVDTGFGTNGVFSLPDSSTGTGMVVVNDAIFIGGSIQGDLAVVSLNADGSPNAAFGTNAIARRTVGSLLSTNDLETLKTGNLYLGASTSDGAIVVALTPTGGSPNFGTNGILNVPLSISSTIGQDATSTFLTVGGRPAAGSANSAALKYLSDGTPSGGELLQYSNSCTGATDLSECAPRGLSVSGVMTENLFFCAWERSGSALIGSRFDGTAFPIVETGAYLDRCMSTTVSAAGLVYMAGDALGLATVVRVNGSSIDMTFNPGGARAAAATAPTGSGLSLAKKIIAQENGSFVIAADAQVNGQGVFGVWRLTSAGKTDLDFGNAAGYATSAVAGTNVTVNAMGVDSENRVIVAGSNGHMVVTRFWQ